jgi:transposase-like protein
MTSTNSTEEVLKQDRRGRVRVPRERREGLLEEFSRSGLSGAEFARMAGIKYATFANWRQQQRRRGGAAGDAAKDAVAMGGEPRHGLGQVTGLRLLEAVVEDGSQEQPGAINGVGLVIELAGGSRLRVDSPVQLAMATELLVLLAQRSRRC